MDKTWKNRKIANKKEEKRTPKVPQSLILCALRGFWRRGELIADASKNGGIWRKKWGKSFFVYYFCFEILLKSAIKPYFMRSSGFLKSRAANSRVLILALEMAWKNGKEKMKNWVGTNDNFLFFLYHFKFSSREIEFAPRREGESVGRHANAINDADKIKVNLGKLAYPSSLFLSIARMRA